MSEVYHKQEANKVTPTFSTSLTKAGEHKLKENSFNLRTTFTKPNKELRINGELMPSATARQTSLRLDCGVKQPLQIPNPTNNTTPNNAIKVEGRKVFKHNRL